MHLFSYFGETIAYALLGSGDIELGKSYMKQVHCENFDGLETLQVIMPPPFFHTMLRLGEDNIEGRDKPWNAWQSRQMPLIY